MAAKASSNTMTKGKGKGKKGAAAAAASRPGGALFELAASLTPIEVMSLTDEGVKSTLTRNMGKPLIVNVDEESLKVLWSEQVQTDHAELMKLYLHSPTQVKSQRGAGRLKHNEPHSHTQNKHTQHKTTTINIKADWTTVSSPMMPGSFVSRMTL